MIPEGKYADLPDGRRVHYHDVGTGHPVLFLHGSGPGASGYSNFKQNLQPLVDQGFRCLVPDHIGYGLSSKPADAHYTLDYLTTATTELLNAVDVPTCAVIGNSLGGAMAIRLALEHPERVSALVLMAPGGLEERDVYMNMRGIRRMLRCIFGPEGITPAGMQKVFELQLHAATLDPGTLAERVAIAETQPRAVFETSRVPNQAPRLAELTCPILTFWGMEDQFCPPTGAWTIANACRQRTTVVTLSECGHWVMVERQDLFDRMTAEFLRAAH